MPDMIDHARLAAMAHGSATAQARILADFRRMNAQDGVLLREAARQEDFAAVGTLAHRMRGASMMLGALDSAETCSLVSRACLASDREALIAALVSLDRQMAQLDAYLGSLCNGDLDALQPVPPVPASQKDAMLCSNLSFLVVEDHAFQRDLIMRFLLRLGAAQVRGFEDGSAALQALAAQPADIMVLDLSMPGIDGMDLMRTLSGEGHPISLILNSALSPSLMDSLIRIAASYRVNLLGAVSKPLTQSSLSPLISKFRAGRTGLTGQTDASSLQ